MPDLETLKTRLSEAETAHHELMIGTREVSVSWSDGQQVTYRKTDVTELRRYIASLRQEIAEITGEGRRAPISLWPA